MKETVKDILKGGKQQTIQTMLLCFLLTHVMTNKDELSHRGIWMGEMTEHKKVVVEYMAESDSKFQIINGELKVINGKLNKLIKLEKES